MTHVRPPQQGEREAGQSSHSQGQECQGTPAQAKDEAPDPQPQELPHSQRSAHHATERPEPPQTTTPTEAGQQPKHPVYPQVDLWPDS